MSCSIEHERSFITSGPDPMLKVGNAVTVLFRWLDAQWHQTLRNTHYISRVTDAYIKAIPVY